MSRAEVTAKLVEAIEAGYDLIVVNYANPDMVGHTGDLEAAIRACERWMPGWAGARALEAAGGAMIVTADHGNCETMSTRDRRPAHRAHHQPGAGDPGRRAEGARLRDGRLADLAPTLLALMGLPKPAEMTGRA
jgi:2,3-bisphosphoglycerate-independent phosphoglycerate mutase